MLRFILPFAIIIAIVAIKQALDYRKQCESMLLEHGNNGSVKGRITVIGFLGIITGLLLIGIGLSLAKLGDTEKAVVLGFALILVGAVYCIGCFLGVRKFPANIMNSKKKSFCSECGQQNEDDAKFCVKCGNKFVTDDTLSSASQKSGKPFTQTSQESVQASSLSSSDSVKYVTTELKDSRTVTAISVVGFVFGLIGMMGSFIPFIGSDYVGILGILAALISAIALGIAYSQNAKKTFAIVAVTISLIGVVNFWLAIIF